MVQILLDCKTLNQIKYCLLVCVCVKAIFNAIFGHQMYEIIRTDLKVKITRISPPDKLRHCKRLHYPQFDGFLSNVHAQSCVLFGTAVGENGSTHARTAGTTFNDFGDIIL